MKNIEMIGIVGFLCVVSVLGNWEPVEKMHHEIGMNITCNRDTFWCSRIEIIQEMYEAQVTKWSRFNNGLLKALFIKSQCSNDTVHTMTPIMIPEMITKSYNLIEIQHNCTSLYYRKKPCKCESFKEDRRYPNIPPATVFYHIDLDYEDRRRYLGDCHDYEAYHRSNLVEARWINATGTDKTYIERTRCLW